MWNAILETISEFWIHWGCAMVVAGVGYATKKWKGIERRQTAIELGMQALLRDRIVQAYYHYEDRQWITLHGLENVEAMYVQYHALGGNGTVTKLVDDLRKLEVRDK